MVFVKQRLYIMKCWVLQFSFGPTKGLKILTICKNFMKPKSENINSESSCVTKNVKKND